MARVDAFNKGKLTRDDEYYTRYDDIQNELNNYVKEFENQIILCNCDDPYESNFFKFFIKNFNYLKLKKLICITYGGSPIVGTQMTLFDDDENAMTPKNGYVVQITSVPMKNGRGVSDEDINELLMSKKRGVKKLKDNGDFRSDECIKFLKEADIVVTNPPFSLFREYVKQLIDYDKKFIIVGRETSITFKDTFQYIMDNKAWYGYTHLKTFDRPDGTTKSFGNVTWFTNLYVSKHHEKFMSYSRYSEESYNHYYNYDGIDIPKVSEIPNDYYGMMGVPLSFLDSWNPEEFEIIGMGQSVPKKIIHKTAGDEIHFINVETNEIVYRVPYSVPERKRGNQLRIDRDGKPGEVPFGRLIIRRIRHNED